MRPPGRPKKDAPPIDPALLMKKCEWCGAVYTKPDIETWARWGKRRFCSMYCYQEQRHDRTR